MKGLAIPKISSMIIIFVIIASVGIVIVSTNPQITDDVIAGFKNTTLSVFGEQIIDVKKPINLSDTGITYNQTNFNDFLLNGSTNVNDIDAFVKQFNWSAVTQDQVPRLFNVNVIDQRTLTNLSEFRDFRDLSRRVEYLEDNEAVSYGGGNPITIGTGDLRDGAVTLPKITKDGVSTNDVILYNGTDWVFSAVVASGNYTLDISNTTDGISIADSDNLTFLGSNGITIQLAGKNVTIDGSGVATGAGVAIPAENITSGTLDDSYLSANVTKLGEGISLPISNITSLITSTECSGTDKINNITINSTGVYAFCTTDETSAGGSGNIPAENITSGTLDDARLSDNVTKLGSTIEQSEISGLSLPSANITNWLYDGTGFNVTSGECIYGSGNTIYWNGTCVNATIEALDSDTIVTTLPFSNITGFNIDDYLVNASNITAGTLGTGIIWNGEVITSTYLGSLTIDGANITSGTLDDARLSANITKLGATIEQSELSGITLPVSNITGITADGTGFNVTTGKYLFGTIPTLNFNETQLNATIEALDSDTTYTAGGGINLTGTYLDLDTSYTDALYRSLTSTVISTYIGSHTHSAINITSGTLDDSRLSANVTILGSTIEQSEISGLTLTVNNITGTLPSSQIGSHVHSAENITSGTLDDSRLSANITKLGSTIEQSEIGGLTLPFSNISSYPGVSSLPVSNITAGTLGAGWIWNGNIITSSYLGSHTIIAENITSGTLDDSRLSANVTKLGSTIEQSELGGLTLPSSNVTGGLDANGVTLPQANITGITLSSANVSAGTFQAGDFTFPQNLTITGNVTISSTASCLFVPGGGKLCGNTTCSTLYSPNGGTIMESCN